VGEYDLCPHMMHTADQDLIKASFFVDDFADDEPLLVAKAVIGGEEDVKNLVKFAYEFWIENC
jgi:hypothetical protein